MDQGPRNVLLTLTLVKEQEKLVQNIVLPYIQSGAWFAHSEAIILSLLCSPSAEERFIGVTKILERRGEDALGDTRVRPRRTPLLNPDATSISTLISWESDVHEPIFTCKMTKAEVSKIVDTPLSIPPFSIHTQSTERVIQQVTQAAKSVVGFSARDGFVRARIESRKALPKFTTKQDILTIFKYD